MGREIESLRQRLEALPVEKAVTKRRVKRDVELSKMVKTAK